MLSRNSRAEALNFKEGSWKGLEKSLKFWPEEVYEPCAKEKESLKMREVVMVSTKKYSLCHLKSRKCVLENRKLAIIIIVNKVLFYVVKDCNVVWSVSLY